MDHNTLTLSLSIIAIVAINAVGLLGYLRDERTGSDDHGICSSRFTDTHPVVWSCKFFVMTEFFLVLAAALWVVFFSW